MELRQLEYLAAVVEEGSFTRAAERVHISQSGVSAQIRELEREVGHVLLDRSARTVRLTEVGAAFLPYAHAALEAVTGARLAVDQLGRLVRGRVRVGMVSGCALPVVPELLAGYHDRYPGVAIVLSEDRSDRLVEALLAGGIDLALIGSAGDAPSGIEVAVVADERLVAVVRPGDPLASRKTVRIASLRDRRLVSLPRGTGVRTALDDACARAGFEPRIAFEASALPMVVRLAGLGLGVAVIPASTVASDALGLHALAIVHPALRSRLELAWSAVTPSNPAARVLIEHTRAYLSQPDANRADVPQPDPGMP